MSDEIFDRGGRIPSFDGEPKNFPNWWKKFTAYATLAKIKDILKEVRDPNLPEKEVSEFDEEDESNKLARIAIKKNESAMLSFSIAFSSDSAMNILYAACTENWPDGEAHLVVRELMKRYRPLDTVSKIEMRQQLSKIRMKKGMNPLILFETLTSIQNQYLGPGKKLPKEELIPIILDVAPEEYRAVLSSEKRMRRDTLTVEDLESAMMDEYRQMTRTQVKSSGTEGEMLLFGQGVCYSCGSPGHRANECPKRRDQSKNQGRTHRFQGKCSTCGVKGHRSKDCWTKEENKDRRPANWKSGNDKHQEKTTLAVDKSVQKSNKGEQIKSMDNQIEYGWVNDDLGVSLLDPDIWIADTGATVHSTSSQQLAKTWKEDMNNTVVVMGNGNRESATKVGSVEGVAIDSDGNRQGRITLSEVLYLPNGKYNLLSVTKVMKSGWMLRGNENEISLEKGDRRLTFNIKIHTLKGTLYAVKIKKEGEVAGISQEQPQSSKKTTKMTVSDAHGRLGHLSQLKTIETAKNLGWELQGSMKRCEDCAIGKGRQKNVNKASNHIVASKPGERIFLDIAAVFESRDELEYVEPTKKLYWRIMVDEHTQFKISDFFISKKAMIEPTCEKLFKLNAEGKNVKYIRCDDGGENRGLMNRLHSSDWKLPIRFEFTGRDTPQRNYLAEVALSTIAGRGRAMMSAAKIPKNMRQMFWREAFQTSTLMDGLMVVKINNICQTRFEHWEGQLPRFFNYLRTWGEAGVVKLRTATTPKIYDRGKTCMLVGYSMIHGGDTYRM